MTILLSVETGEGGKKRISRATLYREEGKKTKGVYMRRAPYSKRKEKRKISLNYVLPGRKKKRVRR